MWGDKQNITFCSHLARATRRRGGEGRKEEEEEEEEEEEGEELEEDQKGMFLSWNQVYFGFLGFWYGD